MISRRILALALTVPLGSCQYGLDVLVSGSIDAPLFTIQEPERSWLDLFASAPLVSMVSVSERRFARGPPREVWAIERSQCLKLPSPLAYGDTPDGFVVRVNAEPLVEDMLYEVAIDGCGHNGSAFFRSTNGELTELASEGVFELPR